MVKIETENKVVHEIKKDRGTFAKKENSAKSEGQTKMESGANSGGQREYFIGFSKRKLYHVCILMNQVFFF